jgi:hypothetical protein
VLPASKKAPILENSSISSYGGRVLEGLFEGKSPDDIFTMLYIRAKLPSTYNHFTDGGGPYFEFVANAYIDEPRISPDPFPPDPVNTPWWRYGSALVREIPTGLNHPTGTTPLIISNFPMFLFRIKEREFPPHEEMINDEINCFIGLFDIQRSMGPILEAHKSVVSISAAALPPSDTVVVGTENNREAWWVRPNYNWNHLEEQGGYTQGYYVGPTGSEFSYWFWGGSTVLIENWYVTRDVTVHYFGLSSEVLSDKFRNVIDVLKPFLDFENQVEDFIEWFTRKVTKGHDDRGYELMIQEIHACIGAGDYSMINSSYSHLEGVAWKADVLAKSFGINYDRDEGTEQDAVLIPIPKFIP